MDGVELEFAPEALDYIAQEAIKRKTGARALRSIVEELMMDIMYDLPSQEDVKHFVITKEMVEKKQKQASESTKSDKGAWKGVEKGSVKAIKPEIQEEIA